MKKGRFTEEQIVKIIQQHEAGMKVGEICREHGISEQTFRNWRSKYSGMAVSEVRRLKSLEAENQQRKKTPPKGWGCKFTPRRGAKPTPGGGWPKPCRL